MKDEREKEHGNTDEREKARALTGAEKKRLAAFEARSKELEGQGWRRTELTVSIVKANVFAVLLLIPLCVIGIGAFLLRWGSLGKAFSPGSFLVWALSFLVLIAVHEGIHGASWALFAPHRFGDIEFGFMKQYLTPYCTCLVPLAKGPYIFGAVMPLVLLGILPMILGAVCGSLPVTLMGILMADAAAGDILIVGKILRHKSRAASVMYIDHPTQAGGVLFEKEAA